MSFRNRSVDYVKNGGDPFCSPQIRAGAGFDTKIAGKDWISQTSLEDTIAAVSRFGIVPLINVGLPDFGMCNPDLQWNMVAQQIGEERIITDSELNTSVGTLHQTVVEDKRKGAFRKEPPAKCVDDLGVLEYYIDAALASDLSPLREQIASVVSAISGRAALSIQWAMQPYELLCFPDTVTTVMLAFDAPELFRRIMDKILKLDVRILPIVADGGADFVFLGAPAAEMVSPRYYEEFIIPYSRELTEEVHSRGLLVYSHICSPIEPFLKMGYYNRMGIDVFETLSPPPVGNVASLKDAMSEIDPEICTRGNVGLDVLLNGTPETVRSVTQEVLSATAGRKHIVAASDYLFYDIPEENVHAMADVVCGSSP